MWFGYLTLAVAFFLSVVAAYYSVLGLVAIFSAAVIPVMIMGGALETGKVVAAMWLHRNWHRAPWTYKAYLLPSLLALMLLTSMGTFGYLSKAHSDQNLVSGDVQSKIALYDEKIRISRENIDANRAALKQLDAAVDQIMGRSTTESGAERSVQIRRQQTPERQRLIREIEAEQKKISELNEARAPIAAEVRKVEAEVGPIKYIAALIYGDNPEANLLESAVRWVIILIVIVFDPLAIVLILAGTRHLEWERAEKTTKVVEPTTTTSTSTSTTTSTTSTTTTTTTTTTAAPPPVEQVYLTRPWRDRVPGVRFPIQVYEKPELEVIVETAEIEDGLTAKQIERVVKETHDTPVTTTTTTEPLKVKVGPGDYMVVNDKVMTKTVAMDLYPELREEITRPRIPTQFPAQADIDSAAANASFGVTFPTNVQTGHMHVHTGTLPSKLYRFNGYNWNEVDKKLAESYTHNEAYIKYLITKLELKEITLDDLAPGERNLVKEYIKT